MGPLCWCFYCILGLAFSVYLSLCASSLHKFINQLDCHYSELAKPISGYLIRRLIFPFSGKLVIFCSLHKELSFVSFPASCLEIHSLDIGYFLFRSYLARTFNTSNRVYLSPSWLFLWHSIAFNCKQTSSLCCKCKCYNAVLTMLFPFLFSV